MTENVIENERTHNHSKMEGNNEKLPFGFGRLELPPTYGHNAK